MQQRYAIVVGLVLAAFAKAADIKDETKAEDASLDDASTGLICDKYPSLHLCKLYYALPSAMGELEYLLELEEPSADLSGPMPEKRKSAFVRFGKRKSAFVRFGKRKSAFVRFGKRAADAEKRKSSYIRFG